MEIAGKTEKEEIFQTFSKHMSSSKLDYFKKAGIDFVIGKREGPYLWDVSGNKRLINCHSNGGVFNLGHRNQEIVNTLKNSLDELDIGNHHLISEHRALLAKKLANLTPGNLNNSVFGVGGGEAVDLAIKMARSYTGRTDIISVTGGYHGHTGLALAAGDKKFREPFGPMAPGFIQIPFNDLEILEQTLNKNTAAILVETIPATLGMPMPAEDYFQKVRSLCNEYGILLIMDEVQTGLGRTGKLWAFEHYHIVPDMMVIGKGLSGGIYPMSATIFHEKLESVFHEDPFIHISTFGGAEVGCPVALKVLEMSSQPAFLENVTKVGHTFSQGFVSLQKKYPHLLVGLRQKGLMMGIELTDPKLGPVFTKAAYENGILSIFAANDTSVCQLLPPLTIDQSLAEEIVERLDHSFKTMEHMLGNL